MALPGEAPPAGRPYCAPSFWRCSHHVEVECTWRYADLETALRGLLSSGPVVRAVRHSGDAQVRRAVTESIAPFRSVQGGYQIENTFRFLVGR